MAAGGTFEDKGFLFFHVWPSIAEGREKFSGGVTNVTSLLNLSRPSAILAKHEKAASFHLQMFLLRP
jgi:hypothetical protein